LKNYVDIFKLRAEWPGVKALDDHYKLGQ